jgi:hypothetical protein
MANPKPLKRILIPCEQNDYTFSRGRPYRADGQASQGLANRVDIRSPNIGSSATLAWSPTDGPSKLSHCQIVFFRLVEVARMTRARDNLSLPMLRSSHKLRFAPP